MDIESHLRTERYDGACQTAWDMRGLELSVCLLGLDGRAWLLAHTVRVGPGLEVGRAGSVPGRVALASSRTCWRRAWIAQEAPSCTDAGVCSPIPEWRCWLL
jgi:hypothetical protein